MISSRNSDLFAIVFPGKAKSEKFNVFSGEDHLIALPGAIAR